MEHNPDINWCTGEVKLTCCPEYCGQAESDSSRLDDNISVQPVETMSDTSERIHATTMISMWLAEAVKGDTPTSNLEEILPKPVMRRTGHGSGQIGVRPGPGMGMDLASVGESAALTRPSRPVFQ